MAETQALGEYGTNGELVPTWKPKTFTYNGSNQVLTITVTNNETTPNVTWVKTFTYTTGNLTGDSGWVRQ